MNSVRFNQLYLLVTGIILVGLGAFIQNQPRLVFSFFNLLIPILLVIDAVSHFFQREEHKKERLIRSLLEITLAIFFVISTLSFDVLTILFGVYIDIKSVALLAKYWTYKQNSFAGRLNLLVSGIGGSIIGTLLLFSAFLSRNQILTCLVVYFVLLGVINICLGMRLFFPTKTIDQLKRKIRLTPPVFIEALIPRFVLKETNTLLEPDSAGKNDTIAKIQETKEAIKPDLEIFIHVTEKSFGSIGHMDLSFEGEIISYGNYDRDSIHLFETIGDGVLVTGAKRDEYIPFCIKHDQKTLFCFGIKLTDEQREGIRASINDIRQSSYDWASHLQRDPHGSYTDYASLLTNLSNCQLHKFHHGAFKTYFVLTTNCVLLADTILGPTGIDLLTINGILTPGTYLEFLRNEFKRADSNVISFEVYN
ncbi:hypothetical protein A5819_002057 [Enterococcus sp. 7E2_DIV0204]|uniref:HdeD family acid-resistance protein n=1 Tax=unclassified Enterococcus TaxID=2608891 RepID=UPI000A32C3BB|nr:MULTISPECIES: hypothetical protein [unclassified Enterococcus]OTN89559.1 hypothetical protein A5819_002057 [Enterococcus sp. 7E2_DIV0204]OTP52015.1 hypothetical protein A5884_001216 [Enterococcus sp. 7D2_DIV0200]